MSTSLCGLAHNHVLSGRECRIQPVQLCFQRLQLLLNGDTKIVQEPFLLSILFSHKSGYEDSNLGPQRPKRRALPN